jgi:hypothetical protein
LAAGDSGFAAEGMRRKPAKVLVGEGVLPAPPLPLKPTVISITILKAIFCTQIYMGASNMVFEDLFGIRRSDKQEGANE